MPGYKNLIEIPTRVPLSTQVAAIIRAAISKHIWDKNIPSERRLSELLNVSRPTLRVALHLLAKDGLIEIRPRQRKRLRSGVPHGTKTSKRTVGIITSSHTNLLGHSNYIHISDLTARLSESGFAVEIFVCKPSSGFPQSAQVTNFLRANRVSCCILLSANKAVQRWFFAQSLPALVLGTCHDTVCLPSVDINMQATCHHAASVFLRNGHRRLALILPDSGLAGDMLSEHGFRKAVDSHNASAKDKDAARVVIVWHNDTAPGLTAKLKNLFRSPEAPTALLVAKQWPTFTTIFFLLKCGLAVPESVSVIARDQDPLYETICPQISHYHFQNRLFTRKAAQLMLKMFSNQLDLSAAPSLILPDYFAGGTVARRRQVEHKLTR